MKRKLTKVLALAAVMLLGAGSVSAEDMYLYFGAKSTLYSSTTSQASGDLCNEKATSESKCMPDGVSGTTYRTASKAYYEITLNSTTAQDIAFWGISSGSSTRTLTAVTVNGESVAASGSIVGNTACTAAKVENVNMAIGSKITFTFDGNVQLNYLVITPLPACTSAEFSFSQEGIEVNESVEDITPLVLTNTQNLLNVTYSSSNTEVVTVDESTGVLTKVGVGEAVITAKAPRQDIEEVTYCAAEASYTVKVLSNSPVLESTEESLNLSLGKFETSKTATFTISGYNLQGDASVTVPDGFTLEPNTFTIDNRAVEQEYQLIYDATEPVAEAIADLVFAVGENSVTIKVTYGKETQTEWASVTTATTWDFAGQIAKETTLTDGLPAQNQVIVLADFPGLTPKDDFNAAALKVRGQRMGTTYWQGDSLTFKVDKAGTIDVTFSNTGSRKEEADRRYLMVQGEIIGQGETSKGAMDSKANEVTVSGIPVKAGEVLIHGVMESAGWDVPQYLRYYKVVYTPETGGPSTICNNPTIDGVTFDGRIITNRAHQMLEVYDTAGRLVIRSAENIDMSAQRGVYLVKGQQAVMKIAITK